MPVVVRDRVSRLPSVTFDPHGCDGPLTHYTSRGPPNGLCLRASLLLALPFASGDFRESLQMESDVFVWAWVRHLQSCIVELSALTPLV